MKAVERKFSCARCRRTFFGNGAHSNGKEVCQACFLRDLEGDLEEAKEALHLREESIEEAKRLLKEQPENEEFYRDLLENNYPGYLKDCQDKVVELQRELDNYRSTMT